MSSVEGLVRWPHLPVAEAAARAGVSRQAAYRQLASRPALQAFRVHAAEAYRLGRRARCSVCNVMLPRPYRRSRFPMAACSKSHRTLAFRIRRGPVEGWTVPVPGSLAEAAWQEADGFQGPAVTCRRWLTDRR